MKIKHILKATVIMGSSTVVSILCSVLKYKYAAHLLGPSGVGLIGILLSFLTLGSVIFILGIDNSSIREIARAKDNYTKAFMIHAIQFGSQILALFAFIIIFLFRDILALYLFDDSSKSIFVVCLGIGISATILANTRNSILNGLSQYKLAAQRNIFSTIVSTIIAIIILHYSIVWGIVAMVIATPISNFLANVFCVSNILRKLNIEKNWEKTQIFSILKKILTFGIIFSISILCSSLMQFLVRIVIRDNLGIADVGYFQASWNVGNTYLTLVLSALSTEYYARISAIAHDKVALNLQVNQQIKAVLLLGMPIIMIGIILAPWIIKILYNSGFSISADILRWQMLGDVFKLISWCVAFALLACGAKYKFLICEILAALFYFIAIWFFTPIYGVKVTGWIYPIWYMLYLLMVVGFARNEFSFKLLWPKSIFLCSPYNMIKEKIK